MTLLVLITLHSDSVFRSPIPNAFIFSMYLRRPASHGCSLSWRRQLFPSRARLFLHDSVDISVAQNSGLLHCILQSTWNRSTWEMAAGVVLTARVDDHVHAVHAARCLSHRVIRDAANELEPCVSCIRQRFHVGTNFMVLRMSSSLGLNSQVQNIAVSR